MNIFFTNIDPFVSAQEHCLIHQNKMIIEYAQLLSSAHHLLDEKEAISGIYKATHKNHPSAIWTRSGQYQYEWVLDCALELCRLYTQRTGKIHKTQAVLETLRELPKNIPLVDWKNPPVCAPDAYKAIAVFKGATVAYQAYLKDKFVEWTSREKPLKVEFMVNPVWL